MTITQKRLDNLAWTGVSGLALLPKNDKVPPAKVPLFYLETIRVDDYESDVYFVNNSEETLSFVAPFSLYQSIYQANAGLGDERFLDNSPEAKIRRAKLYTHDIDKFYTQVLPKQGVRIGKTHIIYDSDGLSQWIIQLPYYSGDTGETAKQKGIWKFNAVEKGGFGQSYVLLWDDYTVPSHMVSASCIIEEADQPLDPFCYRQRCEVLDGLVGHYGTINALYILAINDVLFRYRVGWSAPYQESDIQAQDIAYKLRDHNPQDAESVQKIVRDIYTYWFSESMARHIPLPACAELLTIYQDWLTHSTLNPLV